jgi:acetyl esterase/lipase
MSCFSSLTLAFNWLSLRQSVYEIGIPFFEIKLGSLENRRKASPVHGSFDGFPPVCIVVSEHEICFDQCMLLANRIQRAGSDCSIGIWKYMCHTFPVLSPFIPEGEQAQNFMCNWMISHFEK